MARDTVLEFLKTHLPLRFIKATATDAYFRCPYCGDSRNINHGHLSISLLQPIYHCFRCGKSGTVYNLFEDLKLDVKPYNIDLVYNVSSIAERLDKEVPALEAPTRVVRPDRMGHKSIFLPDILLTPPQKRYLEERLRKIGINKYTFAALGVVSSRQIQQYIQYRNYRIQDAKKFLWFRCYRNAGFVGRYIGDNVDKKLRYKTIKVAEGADLFYLCPANVNMHTVRMIIVTEGIFDAIAMALKHAQFVFPEYKNRLAAIAILGSNYVKVTRFLDANRFLLDQLQHIVFAIQNDVDIEKLRLRLKRFKKTSLLPNRIKKTIITNTAAKDFAEGPVKIKYLYL